MEKAVLSNRFILHPQFKERVHAIKNNIELPLIPSLLDMNNDERLIQTQGNLSIVGGINKIRLDPRIGRENISKFNFLAYDESIEKFQALEGSGYITCHSMILLDEDDYLACNCLSFAFYTRSKKLLDRNNTLRDATENKNSTDEEEDAAESAFKRDYAKERAKFILKNCPNNAILIIDGPLIGKQMSDYTVELNQKLLEKSVIPIFVVKNSQSNLVTDNIPDLKGDYNSIVSL